MKAHDIRDQWERFWTRIDADAKAQKVSQAALFELSRCYASLSSAESEAVDLLLAEWALSSDENKRFDAVALIEEHRILTAISALEALHERLEQSRDPGAPYERAKVERILSTLRVGA